MWLKKKDRSLPYWPLQLPFFSFHPISKFLFANRIFDVTITLYFYMSLYYSLWNKVQLIYTTMLFYFLGFVDMWRLINSHQWLFAMTSLLMDNPEGVKHNTIEYTYYNVILIS
jgi:hypothetical protein